MIKETVADAEKRMKSAIQSLQDDLAVIRTGRANPSLVERMSVEYYGSPVPLIQLATISVPEPRQLMIKPFDQASIKDIEKAIYNFKKKGFEVLQSGRYGDDIHAYLDTEDKYGVIMEIGNNGDIGPYLKKYPL